ncbi:peptidylprolyl isomerase [Erythrobacter alti]|uniref:peptidylprolyl isomerase n=1 Tax=Erythrobacter alti TaxID=1896145 RepID=UPI0030F3A8B1
MFQIFRNFFKSKVGIVVTLAFLGLIAVAFASSDVANTGMFGGVAGGDRVAVVGDRTISTADLQQNANNALQQSREENPTLSMEGFVAQGGFDDVLSQMLSRAAIAEFAEMIGFRAGKRLVDSEIQNAPGFQGIDGTFNVEAFRNSLRQRNLTESTVREDLALSLLARQSVVPISFGARMPDSMARTYAQLLNDTRTGTAAVFPASAFAPQGDPTDEQIQAYYNENRARYIRPERRVIRYAAFSEDAVSDLPPVTAAQIAARYEADSVLYRATERRTFTQLVVPTQAAGQAVVDEVRGGVTLEASARSKGLATTQVSEVERPDYASTASQAVAGAGFDAAEGGLVGPVRGSLGWYVFRVDDVTPVAARSLEQVRDEIRETLIAERRREALNELTERLETEFGRGRTLEEAAAELGAEIQSTPPLLANGQVYGQDGQAPPALSRVVSFAFEMSANSPEITELVPGEAYLIFDVSEITPSATAPLAEIRDGIVQQWRRDQGMAAAGRAAGRVLERVEGGASLAEAVAAEEVELPSPQNLRINRRELAQQGQITRATILFFSMAEGTVERVAVPEASQWYVVSLEDIETAELDEDSQDFVNTAAQLSEALGQEYVEQFVTAAEAAVEIERNEAGIEAVRALLTGGSN